MLEFRMVSGQVIKILVSNPQSELEKIYNGSQGSGLIKFDNNATIINIGNVESIEAI